MRKGIGNILLLSGLTILLVSGTAWGQYYQYTDENGVLRYTDNLAVVPPDQREDVKTHESVVSAPVEENKSAATSNVSGSQPPAGAAASKRPAPAGSWKEGVSKRKAAAEELDHMQAELNQAFMTLQNEKSELTAKEPPPGAASKEKQAYRRKVEALNKKIERYENQLKVFKEKEAAFMAMGKE
jgi:hypothetical protein